MRGSTPTQRAKSLDKELKKLYDEYGKDANVIDMLTDIRHLCDAKDWNFHELNRVAYNHYIAESVANQHNSQKKG